MKVKFVSFGIKHGMPGNVDTCLDVRALPNPYWVDELRELSGEDQKAIDYMMSFPITKKTLDSLTEYLSNLLEIVSKEQNEYTIGVFCTGGRHRSTFVANYLSKYFSTKYETSVFHRDYLKEINHD